MNSLGNNQSDDFDSFDISEDTHENRRIYNMCDFCGGMPDSEKVVKWVGWQRNIGGVPLPLPFRCSYCGGLFCINHHLPENHNCPNLHLRSVSVPISRKNEHTGKRPITPAPKIDKKPIFKSTHCSLCGRHIYVGISSGKLPPFGSFVCKGCGSTFCKNHLPRKAHHCHSHTNYSMIKSIKKIVVSSINVVTELVFFIIFFALLAALFRFLFE